MEKAYVVLDNDRFMTAQEIEELYDGWWVFLTNAEFSEDRLLLGGIPRVIGKRAYAGVKDGIYDKFKSQDSGVVCDMVLLRNEATITSVGF